MFHTAQLAAPQLKQRQHMASRPISARLDERWIAFVGKLSLEKGVHCLISAAPEIIARVPNVHFLLIGDGVARSHLVAMRDALAEGNLDATVAAMRCAAETSPESYAEWVAEYWAGLDLQHYCALARAADLKHRIVFTGYQTASNVARLITHADIVVIPSLIKEAFPLVSVEALSSGLMIVAPYDGGLAPVLDKVAAELDSVGSLARISYSPASMIPELIDRVTALLRYTEDDTRRAELAKMCRDFALKHYDWTNIVSRIESVYVSALYGHF